MVRLVLCQAGGWVQGLGSGEVPDKVDQGSPFTMELAELKALAPQLHALLARYQATNLAVFGSVARDQAQPDSDVDLLVDLPSGLSLFERADLKLALEDLLHHRVDLVRRRNLKPEIRDRVEAEAIAI